MRGESRRNVLHSVEKTVHTVEKREAKNEPQQNASGRIGAARKRLAEGAAGGVECRRTMREFIQWTCFGGLMLCGALSLWPFRFARRWMSWSLYLPVAGLVLYAFYEMAMPEVVDVRAQMSAIVPMMMFLWLNGIVKVGLLAVLMNRAGGSRRRLKRLPQRGLQVMLALPILAGCAFWVWTTTT